MPTRIADDFTGDAPGNTWNEDKPGGRPSAATQLVELALNRYHFGATEDWST
jgi:hypothetical protein